MPLREELRARLHDVLALELNLRAYLREWETRVSSPALREGLEAAVSSIGPEADGLAKCLHHLGTPPKLASESPVLEAFRHQDTQWRAKAPQETELRCAVSVLALGDVKVSLYRSMIALAQAGRYPEVEEMLREVLAHVEGDQEYLQGVFRTLLGEVGRGRRREAA